MISNHEHFWSLVVNDFPLFLTFCKCDAFSDLCVCCVHYATKDIQIKELHGTTHGIT